MLLGSGRVKAAHKSVDEINPRRVVVVNAFPESWKSRLHFFLSFLFLKEQLKLQNLSFFKSFVATYKYENVLRLAKTNQG